MLCVCECDSFIWTCVHIVLTQIGSNMFTITSHTHTEHSTKLATSHTSTCDSVYKLYPILTSPYVYNACIRDNVRPLSSWEAGYIYIYTSHSHTHSHIWYECTDGVVCVCVSGTFTCKNTIKMALCQFGPNKFMCSLSRYYMCYFHSNLFSEYCEYTYFICERVC